MENTNTESRNWMPDYNPWPEGSIAWVKWKVEKKRESVHLGCLELLEGKREPADEKEKEYLRLMGGVKGPREKWPKKWCVCLKCGAEWKAAGFPAGEYGGMFGARNRFGRWLFPDICECCEEEDRAIAPPPVPKEKKTSPHRADIED